MANETVPGVPKRTVLTIAGSAGALLLVSATIFCRYFEIAECPNPAAGITFNPQGLNYFLPQDGYVQEYALNPADIISGGDRNAPRDRGVGVPALPYPDGTTRAAQPYAKLISATATGSYALLLEWA